MGKSHRTVIEAPNHALSRIWAEILGFLEGSAEPPMQGQAPLTGEDLGSGRIRSYSTSAIGVFLGPKVARPPGHLVVTESAKSRFTSALDCVGFR
jgi:hypothetical protein